MKTLTKLILVVLGLTSTSALADYYGRHGGGGGRRSSDCEQALRNVESARFAKDQAYQLIFAVAPNCKGAYAAMCLYPYQQAYNSEVIRLDQAQRIADYNCR